MMEMEPIRPRGPSPLPEADLTLSATTQWATFDSASVHLQSHLEEIIDDLLSRGVELVGFYGTPDALAAPGWERILHRFLISGFRCLLQSPLSVPLTRSQLDLLGRLEEIQVPALGGPPASNAPLEENLHRLQEQLGESPACPPRIVRTGAQGPLVIPDAQPAGHTRGCLDPWEGLVGGPSGETFPCAVDRGSLGDHRQTPLAQLLNGPLMKQRRTDLLRGTLPPPCRTCSRTGWVDLEELHGLVIQHTRRILRPEPPVTSEEIGHIVEAWISEGRRVLVYPAGNHARWFLQTAPALAKVLVGFGDRDPAKQASSILGLPVHAPEAISTEVADLVLIVAGDFEDDIHQSLRPLADRGIEVLAASRLHRHWQRLSALQARPHP